MGRDLYVPSNADSEPFQGGEYSTCQHVVVDKQPIWPKSASFAEHAHRQIVALLLTGPREASEARFERTGVRLQQLGIDIQTVRAAQVHESVIPDIDTMYCIVDAREFHLRPAA